MLPYIRGRFSHFETASQEYITICVYLCSSVVPFCFLDNF